MNDFQNQDWSWSIYSSPGEELKDELPLDMPEPLGQPFVTQVYVDADHAGETVTRRSRSGHIFFLNSVLIYWPSKKQTSCETSTLGSDFLH